MIHFLIYLFESGLCLSLLFLVYFLFLRKETYFTFNRIYLAGILILSLILPFIHLKLTVAGSTPLAQQATELQNFKNYYERLISLTDPDFAEPFTKPFQQRELSGLADNDSEFLTQNTLQRNNFSEAEIKKIKTGFWADFNWARVLLILYLCGILFFAGRLLLLFHWLSRVVQKYGSTLENGVKLVKMDEEVPPFSFFRFVFLNREANSLAEFEQILAHEKVHIRQRHSLDLIMAHFITVFQWFNPFAWLINNAMKTNHEYIADRKVVEQGYELFDYQSLLLKQMISIRSVELVNNFNLINIKKRIAMMTKIKSGIFAQLKALVIIPAALFLFFFFAEITFAHSNADSSQKKEIVKIDGLWERTSETGYGKLVLFKENKVVILTENNEYKEFEFSILHSDEIKNPEVFVKPFKEVNGKPEEISFLRFASKYPDVVFDVSCILRGNELIIDWDRKNVTRFEKSNSKNSLDLIISKNAQQIEPVSLEYYQITENPEKNFFILMNKNGELMLDGQRFFLEKLPARIQSAKSKGNPFEASEKVPILVIDASCKMSNVSALFQKLREINELRHILSVKPFDNKVPEVFYHNVGIPRLLPPNDAQLMDEAEVEKSGMKIHRIDITKATVSPGSVKNMLEKEIRENQKYVILYIYKNETSYKDYLTYLDQVYQVIFEKRDQLAQKKYNLAFNEIAPAQQKEIRAVYPLTLTERNVSQ